MCNIAGYVGIKQAAPILLEMMKKEEGFAGGYNTGIATINEGKIYSAKLVGSTDKLIAETDALSFGGTVGICHSRSQSHSGSEWAHPFLGFENGQPVCAYIANGNAAKTSDKQKENAVADSLNDAGYLMQSRIENPTSKANYPTLKDGSKVHSSDVICQLALKNIQMGHEAPVALENAFTELIAERVGLLLTLNNTDAIAWARGNMPVFVAFADHGAYIASTPLAFPEDAGEPMLLPANSCGWLYKDMLTNSPFNTVNLKVPEFDACLINRGYDIIVKELENGPKSFNDLLKPLSPLFEDCECMTRAALTYTVLYSLKKQDKIEISTILAPPIFEGIDVPKFIVTLK